MDILSITEEGLGHTSHLIGLGDGTALVIDPTRFPDRQRSLAMERGWRIAWAADTHSHADYISGSPALAVDGAVFVAPARARLEHAHRGVEPGEDLAVADGVVLRAIPTPGHTPDHLAYLLLEHGDPVGLFSGGSLMVGTVGRTDLFGDEHTERLAAELFWALQHEILTLPDDLAVYPTHGAGSFCSAPSGSRRVTTLGAERATNPLLQVTDEHEFVERLVSSMGSFPTYFRELPERNRRGRRHYPTVPVLARLAPDHAVGLVADGAVLVDARPVAAFAAAHPAGAISNTLRPVFGSWLGWLVELDTPLVFLLDDDQDRAELVRHCLTVGHEHLLGEIDGGIDAWTTAGHPTASIPLVRPGTMADTVLDVRQDGEWQVGHLPEAQHVELGAVRAMPLPGGPTTIMCGHGERAMTAASVLASRGHAQLTVLDGGPDEWQRSTDRVLETGR
jgi:glyoxylase-like metal-dependent hydrolase (beta-lactamase superfamily II)/rhodanese-related sulfurtransferase